MESGMINACIRDGGLASIQGYLTHKKQRRYPGYLTPCIKTYNREERLIYIHASGSGG